jgi:hypothetical protein
MRPGPLSDLSEAPRILREITRDIAERAASICADAAQTRAESERILSEIRAARETRRASR